MRSIHRYIVYRPGKKAYGQLEQEVRSQYAILRG